MKNKLLLLVFILSASCSNIGFVSTGEIDTTYGVPSGEFKEFEVSGSKEFFFWGISPDKEEVYVDHLLADLGLLSAHRIIVEQYQTLPHLAYTILTLGLYCPKDFTIRAYGIKNDSRN